MTQTRLAFTTILLLAFSLLFAQKKTEIPFTIAKNYFVNNSYKTGDLSNYKILTAQKFEQLIGMATLMGPDGKPTEIDFSKQFVIIVVNPQTDSPTKLTPEKLTATGSNKLIFEYKTEIGEKTTYTMTPFTMIIVDKKYKNRKIIVKTHTL
jgi:hypothetical protein